MNYLIQENLKSDENIKCYVRCRPLNEKETLLGAKCISLSEDSTSIFIEKNQETQKSAKNQNNQYTMDKIFNEEITQVEIFNEIGLPILQNFLSGYNCTLFCYGQTGAGKTHTMMGPLDELYETNSELHGLIPRFLHFIFSEKETVNNIITNNSKNYSNISIETKICVTELYREQIIDLLSKENLINDLKIKEDNEKGMYIQNLTEMPINTAKEAKDIILIGLKHRHVAATEMNVESSRSHLIVSLYLKTSYINEEKNEIKKFSRLHLIDLAGSERQKLTKANAERIKEACMINKSLSTLGNVINALVENKDGKNKYVPFRDSKLTYFLKDSLGGNSKTTIVANISCSIIQINETISTLKFVQRAKMIKNSVSMNMSVQDNIEALQEEIRQLKEIIAKGGIDLSALNKENSDYICPICHNQPIEVNRECIMKNFKEEILNLSDKLVKNLTYGDEIKKQLLSIDSELGKSG